MGLLSRKMQRTLKNLRVSLLCFLLTFLVLRNTIGAGKFGTPAQDFEEIRLHLHNVALHRRQLRVLVEAVEEEKPLLEALWEKEKQRSTITASFEDIQENAAVLTVDTRHRKTPALTTVKGIQDSLLAVAKNLEGSRFANHDEQRYVGESKVVVIAGFHSSGCKKPLAEQLLLKSLKNRVHYSTLHGFQVPLSSETLERLSSIPYSRLSLLQGTMEKYPHVEWIWWVPNEALIITDIAFKFPLQMYSEFNFVLLGFVGATYHTENLIISLKTDSFLIRNSQWTLEVVRNSADLSSRRVIGTDMLTINNMISKPDLEGVASSSLDDDAPPNQPRRTSRGKVYVEDSTILRSNLKDPAFKLEKFFGGSRTGLGHKRLPFITHFLGCELCQDVGKEEDGKCLKQMERAYLFVEEQVGLQLKDLGSTQSSLM